MSGVENPTDRAGARTTISLPHSQSHAGNRYTIQAYEKVNAGSGFNIFIIAPPEKEGHFVFALETDGPGLWELAELTDASGGTALVEFNHYRAKQTERPATAILTSNALVTSAGTILERGVIGSAGKFETVGGGGATRTEWIFEDSAEYILVFTADTASCRTVLHADWYELVEP